MASGFYRQEEELNDSGANEQLRRHIAQFKGGRFNPSAAQLFDPGGWSVASTTRLWPGLLAFAHRPESGLVDSAEAEMHLRPATRPVRYVARLSIASPVVEKVG